MISEPQQEEAKPEEQQQEEKQEGTDWLTLERIIHSSKMASRSKFGKLCPHLFWGLSAWVEVINVFEK